MFLFGLGWRVKVSSLGAGVINESWWVSEKSESEVSEVRWAGEEVHTRVWPAQCERVVKPDAHPIHAI